nr:MAG TPA: hypothetical protein [Bacteriophage sp.]
MILSFLVENLLRIATTLFTITKLLALFLLFRVALHEVLNYFALTLPKSTTLSRSFISLSRSTLALSASLSVTSATLLVALPKAWSSR